MHLLKKYMQYHEHEFERFELIEPELEVWHTESTNLSRVFETHWGRPLSIDPSTLGHSARKMGRQTPSNLKKVDYYPGAQLGNLVLGVRMLDCGRYVFVIVPVRNIDRNLCTSRLAFGQTDIFEYFKVLGEKQLPAIEDLEIMARKLYRAYTSSQAQYRAMHDTDGRSEWSKIVPLGTAWTGPLVEESSGDVGITAKKPRASKTAKSLLVQTSSASVVTSPLSKKGQKGSTEKPEYEVLPEVFKGDRVLARSIALMRDLMWSRECAYAVAEGDSGRL
jgi:hypothetical protein